MEISGKGVGEVLEQDTGFVAIDTPLGKDEVVITALKGFEHLSQLFHFDISLLSEDHKIDGDKLLGENVTVRLIDEKEEKRFFNGYVTSFSQLPSSDRYAYYQIEVKPWLWFLTRTSDCRTFQNKKVPDILTEVIKKHGFDKIKNKLTESYRTWEYCVQYRETDFNFVSRLMEQEGIYYYFEHLDGEHYLVLADGASGHEKMKNYPSVSYYQPEDGVRESDDHIWEWQLTRKVHSGKYQTDSFDFSAPKKALLVKQNKAGKFKQSGFEVFDYLGDYSEKKDGDQYAKIRMEEIAQDYEVAQGGGDVRGLVSGSKFELTGYPRSDQNREYVVLGVNHELQAPDYESGGSGDGELYENRFSVMDAKTQFRAPQRTPKPEIKGPQTAIVTTAGSEEITTDEHGRVKVKFHWDRHAKDDDTSSCWIRVSQSVAGKQWGSIMLPREGQEVIVEYLEGDPDRPIITGSLYNGDQKPPYKLPANQSQSGIKSRSTKKGKSDNFNELRFEDKKDEEQVYFHAEKDFERIVENDDILKVGFDKKDKGDQKIDIFNDRTTTLEQGKDTLTIKKGDRIASVDQGDDKVTIKLGDQTVKVNAGKTLHQAAKSLELKVGASSIKIEPAKITIKSPQIDFKADVKLEAKSTIAKVNASGMLELKGSMTKIN
jgi:type VI secretion system secreted protein VgrG